MGINYYLFYLFMDRSAGSFELGHHFWEEEKKHEKTMEWNSNNDLN